MNKCKIGLIVAFVCVFVGIVAATDPPKPEPIPAEEYEVYAAAMDDMVGGMSYVVFDTTSIHGDAKDLDRALSFEVSFEKFVTDDLVKDFIEKNKQRYPITRQFPEKLRVTLLSEREESELFRDSTKDGWKTFREKYMSSSGITRLSRVGFNKNHDVAVVYVSNVANWEVGRGACVLLQKVDGKWKVIAQSRGWIA